MLEMTHSSMTTISGNVVRKNSSMNGLAIDAVGPSKGKSNMANLKKKTESISEKKQSICVIEQR